jgi:hypothetical protein
MDGPLIGRAAVIALFSTKEPSWLHGKDPLEKEKRNLARVLREIQAESHRPRAKQPRFLI